MVKMAIFSFAVIIHIILLYSVFDIYFKSPVITGISPINNTMTPVGKRVVLISVDGLRFDSLFVQDASNMKDVMPYVKNIIQERGTWGMSECHVPTESRPGHVAMLAGLYEDPSAFTNGWTENPVTFDSVFNQSYCSFAWGSPDILNIFFKGLNRNCAFSNSYDDEQNFAGNTMEYDNWVYEELKSFLQNSRKNKVLFDKGVFFFLHLLGQDTSGHTHKPHSEKYIENTKNVDRLVKEIEYVFNEFYGDNLTSFIFTSDHGMTDWGSHGSGHPVETNTPFIAWGAGISKPLPQGHMINISQADITPLLAILLGSSIPVNSVGSLPIGYLNLNEKDVAEAMLLNAKQITAQFQMKLQKIQAQIISFFHSPFEKLTNEELELMITSISKQINNKHYTDATEKSKVLIEIALEGLEYYHNYYQRLLLISITSCYVFWIFYLILDVYDTSKPYCDDTECTTVTIFVAFATVTLFLTLIQKLPLTYVFYFLLPQFLLFLLARKIRKSHYLTIKKNKIILITSILFILTGVETIVASFFQRWLLCVSLMLLLLWGFSSMHVDKSKKSVVLLWIMSGAALSGFCLLPTIGGQPSVIFIVISGFVLFVGLLLMFLLNLHRENVFIFSMRCLVVATAAWNSSVVHANFDYDDELPRLNQVLSWCLSALALVLSVVGEPLILERFDQLFISFLVPFLLLSIRHEGLFIMCLFIHLRCWIQIEYDNDSAHFESKKTKKSSLTFHDFRRAYFFLFYVWIGFFGLGNIASLNSFDPAWVRCFLTVFSPFLMAALILFKTIIPFLIVTSSMRTLTVLLKLAPDQLFKIVLIYCNVMGLNFLYFITNKGSWLDIGSSISHYVIQQVAVVFLLILYGIAKFLLSFSFYFPTERGKSKRSGNSAINSLDSAENSLSLPRFYSNYKLHRS